MQSRWQSHHITDHAKKAPSLSSQGEKITDLSLRTEPFS